MRSVKGRVTASPGKVFAPGSCGERASALFCIGRKLRRPVGLRPGANRRGNPSRAARVMTAATERPSRSAITGGASPASHIVRSNSSCSAQLASTKPAAAWLPAVAASDKAVAVFGFSSIVTDKTV